MNKAINPKNVHPPLGTYVHSVSVPPGARWVAVSGQVGMDAKGKLAAGMRKQAELAFRNILGALKAQGMTKKDLVKLTVFVTDPRGIDDYRAARRKVIGDAVKPASTLLVIDGLASADMLIEIEAWAARG